MMRRAAALLCVALAVAGCQPQEEPIPDPRRFPSSEPTTTTPTPTVDAAALAPYQNQKPRWQRCGGPFQCATLRVPLDYYDIGRGEVRIAVIRRPAGEPSRRVGTLVVNPGGPGGSGVDQVRAARAVFSDRLLARYDVVGFDPRGVGESEPMDCLSDGELDRFLAVDGSPDNAAERAEWVRQSQAFGDGCKRRSPRLVAHVGTREVAWDIDVLRAALGEERLNYLGSSYGTRIGAFYAELFPHRVGRMVLDGAVDPQLSGVPTLLRQAQAFERAVAEFVADCVRRSGCPVGRDRSEAVARIRAVVVAADVEPLRSAGGRSVTQSLALLGLLAGMYDPERWAPLRSALRDARDGDGTGLLELADLYAERDPDGRYRNNANEVILAVTCLDEGPPVTAEDIERELPRFREASPIFGEWFAWGLLPCTYWPAAATSHPHPVRAEGAAPIVVVGTTRDPATPYAWAQSLARQLASGVLVTWEGDGHLAYRRSTCVTEAVDRYLISGTVPADGFRCG